MNLKKRIKKSKFLFSLKRAWIPALVILIVLGIASVGLAAYAKSYEDRVLPGVRIGSFSIGGMDREELGSFLHMMGDNLIDEGITIVFSTEKGEQSVNILSSFLGEDQIFDIIQIDTQKEAERFTASHKKNTFLNIWSVVLSRITRPKMKLEYINFDKENFLLALEEKLTPFASKPQNASVKTISLDALEFEITTSSPGFVFYYDDIEDKIISSWSQLKSPEIKIERRLEEPEIIESDVASQFDRLPAIFRHGNLELKYTDPHTKRQYNWIIDKQKLSQWINAQKTEDGIGFGLSKDLTNEFLQDKVALSINVESKNAKFNIGKDGKVKEFQGSRPGVELDMDETYNALNDAFLQRNWHDEGITNVVTALAKQTEPDIKTGEVNELGIKEILGIGYSNYSGSPPNRIKNIRHAVYDKLNGLLIEPDEEFSLLGALAPFTVEGGYLPELVIKGDEIKPEVGGGLCQIGTTMFRAVMNSGLPITQRRNHSLVVSYYNDHRNGNPGTDATVYDPSPDVKFINDTEHYMLLTTQMNESTGELFFTLWGTSDGRKGYYTEPIVTSWIGHGPLKEIESTDLAPGQKKCQGAHVGAETYFTYIRELPSGEKIERIFESYYRPLPAICLIGVEEKSSEYVCEILPTGEESCNFDDGESTGNVEGEDSDSSGE